MKSQGRRYDIEPGTNIYHLNFGETKNDHVPNEIPLRNDEACTGEQYYLIRRIKRHKERISGRYHFRI